ncbi:hypothetical protein A9Q83_12185 [Alphaproteobacteria bacterium 46_93_T64]|nr:hypothetical protein A9Q83_12185 [Alphaproteobacteria bacterium 46_93_T64]
MSETKQLSELDAVELARKGDYETWNKWSEKNPEQYLDFTFITNEKKFGNLKFSNFIFTGSVNFSYIELFFASFKNTEFKHSVNFMGTIFKGVITDFSDCKFWGITEFSDTRFLSLATRFNAAHFYGEIVDFNEAEFGEVDVSNHDKFEASTLSFKGAVFKVGELDFTYTEFNLKNLIDFKKTKFECELVNFYGAKFKKGHLRFGEENCFAEDFQFKNVQLSEEGVVFQKMSFFGKFDFSYSDIYSRQLKFENVIFEKAFDFSKSKLSCESVDFLDVKFLGDYTNFEDIKVGNGNINFPNSSFLGQSSFAGSIFKQSLNFEQTSFKLVPDFRRTQIAAHFTFHAMTIDTYDPVTAVGNEQDKYRRLKEIAIQSKDHEKELEFFANELRAKNHEENKGITKIPIWIYEKFSDFGRSISRPFAGLLSVWFVFGALYWLGALFLPLKPTASLVDGLKLSAAVLLPFMPTSREAFGDNGARDKLFDDPGLFLDLANYTEGFLGIFFLFLIGLALRNRFRL